MPCTPGWCLARKVADFSPSILSQPRNALARSRRARGGSQLPRRGRCAAAARKRPQRPRGEPVGPARGGARRGGQGLRQGWGSRQGWCEAAGRRTRAPERGAQQGRATSRGGSMDAKAVPPPSKASGSLSRTTKLTFVRAARIKEGQQGRCAIKGGCAVSRQEEKPCPKALSDPPTPPHFFLFYTTSDPSRCSPSEACPPAAS